MTSSAAAPLAFHLMLFGLSVFLYFFLFKIIRSFQGAKLNWTTASTLVAAAAAAQLAVVNFFV